MTQRPFVTAVEIEKKGFSTSFRGFNPTEVRAYLELVASEVESLTKENRSLREKLAEIEKGSGQLREQEERVKETLLLAQTTAVEARLAARKDAGLIVREAEIERTRIANEIERLSAERDAFVAQLRSFLEAFYERLEAKSTQPELPQAKKAPEPAPDVRVTPVPFPEQRSAESEAESSFDQSKDIATQPFSPVSGEPPASDFRT